MPTRILARRVAALITCRILHQSGELDDSLSPIGKEGFRATEPDWENFDLEKNDEEIVFDNVEPRPGTTKRRQYYYKRVSLLSHKRILFCYLNPLICRLLPYFPIVVQPLVLLATCTKSAKLLNVPFPKNKILVVAKSTLRKMQPRVLVF